KSFLDDATIDQELIVRSAQVHALMPMMQFSVAPWRVLSDQNQKIVNHMARLHSEMGEQIMELVRHSAKRESPSYGQWPMNILMPAMLWLRINSCLDRRSWWRPSCRKTSARARSKFPKEGGPRIMGRNLPVPQPCKLMFP